jgi:hypothetical protein
MAKQWTSAKEQAQAAKAAKSGRARDYQALVNTQIRNAGKNKGK